MAHDRTFADIGITVIIHVQEKRVSVIDDQGTAKQWVVGIKDRIKPIGGSPRCKNHCLAVIELQQPFDGNLFWIDSCNDTSRSV